MIFKLTLHKAYYQSGFFNVKREIDHLIRQDEGEVTVSAGTEDTTFTGMVDRRANRNGTARIRNLKGFKHWFQKNYSLLDVLDIEIVSPSHLKIRTLPTRTV